MNEEKLNFKKRKTRKTGKTKETHMGVIR